MYTPTRLATHTSPSAGTPSLPTRSAAPARPVGGKPSMSLLNLAARQRMLSQRMVLQTMLAAQDKPGALTSAQASFQLFCDSHQQLAQAHQGMDAAPAAQLREIYQSPRGVGAVISAFMDRMRTTLAHIGAGHPHVQSALDHLVACTDPVLDALNTATTTFDAIARTKEETLMKELTSIVNDIQTVAREAKVVSFNAQVIAARAGEHGRGFAVVANVLSNIATDIDRQSKVAMDLTARNRASLAC